MGIAVVYSVEVGLCSTRIEVFGRSRDNPYCELIPLIDRTYRTRADREGRVIAGFSMGGGGAVRLALKHPDLFSAAASWAAALGSRGGGLPPQMESIR